MAHVTQDDGPDATVEFTIWLTNDELAGLFTGSDPVTVDRGDLSNAHVVLKVQRYEPRTQAPPGLDPAHRRF